MTAHPVNDGDIEKSQKIMHEEGQGIYTIDTYSVQKNMPEMIKAAYAGNVSAREMVMMLHNFLQNVIAKQTTNEPVECLICRSEFVSTLPGAYTVISPYVSTPTAVTLSALCQRCTDSPESLPDRLMTALKDTVAPDFRELKISNTEGTA